MLLAALCHAPASADPLADRLAAARAQGGVAPQRALVLLQALRQDAVAAQRLDVRLAVDEVECQLQADLDTAKAAGVAQAGLSAAGAGVPAGAARHPWLRLRVCEAGALLDEGDPSGPLAGLEALLAQTTDEADAVPHALAMLSRGVHRSRSGAYEAAQQDLLAACETLRLRSHTQDAELCLGHLSSHYRRVGDLEEALTLLTRLHEAARRRGAAYDAAIHVYNIAQVRQAQERWDEALAAFADASEANERLGDATGVAYSEHGIADALLRLGRAEEALVHADRGLARLAPGADERQREAALITRAEALVALGRTAEAAQLLDGVRAAVHDRGELPALADWLLVRAQVARQQGRWQDAYTALAEARRIEQRLHAQRLSQNAARMRMQFNRARDEEELSTLRQLNEQGQRLRQTQALALALFVTLLGVAMVYGVRKFRQARTLQSLASTDELTGLANRRALMALAQQALAGARRDGGRLALLMIDVDHFKRINDAHGHGVGDAVLRQLAQTLAQGLRERDRLGRLGGEEFLAVLPDADEAAAHQVAERMRAAVAAAPLPRAEGALPYTVSIGVAGVRPGDTTDALIARADAALYRAKAAGRDRVVVAEPAAA